MEKTLLRNIRALQGLKLHATDGELGAVKEFYFDDEEWDILYLVADTGGWLPGRRLLISPIALGEADWVEQRLEVMLTREEVEASPDIDLHRPITREQEVTYFGHFGWPCFWKGELRSASEVIGTQVEAEGGAVGNVEDLLVDEFWRIRYLMIVSEDRRILVAPQWIKRADWPRALLHLNLSREKTERSPEYDPSVPVSREFEAQLYNHYGLTPYWS